MSEISLCMIVKNEEKYLASCLDSVYDLVDEIVIVDTGSTDKTKEIAARYTDKIYDFEWIDDFAAARNFAFSKGSKEYLMWLDADDIMTKKNRLEFSQLKKSLGPQHDIVSLPYEMTAENGEPADKAYRERLIRRSLGLLWQDRVHEYIDLNLVPKERRYNASATITHTKPSGKSERNLHLLESVVKEGKPSLRILFNYANELSRFERRKEAIKMYEQFFDGGGLSANEALYACLRLYALYLETGQPEKAFALLDICRSRLDDRSEFCCCMGHFYQDVNEDSVQAERWYKEALNCPKTSDKFNYSIGQYYYHIPYYNLGQLYLAQGKLPKAKDCLTKALDDLKGEA